MYSIVLYLSVLSCWIGKGWINGFELIDIDVGVKVINGLIGCLE